MQILNIDNNQIKDMELIEKRFKHLFDVNEKSKGGSFYIQSKVSLNIRNYKIVNLFLFSLLYFLFDKTKTKQKKICSFE